MKAIIMAAGKGSRISNQIGAIPKSMLEINGRPIIRVITEMLISLGLETIVCVGYQAEMIKAALSGLSVRFYYNPLYDITNNIVSLWFAREEINDDVILLSADLVFQQEIVEMLIEQKHPLTMAVDKSRILDGDFFLKLSDEGHVLGYDPQMPVEQRSCEYMGLSKINRNASERFLNRLDEMINTQKHQLYFENIFMSFNNDKELWVDTVDVSGLEWREIDFYDDYVKAQKQFPSQ